MTDYNYGSLDFTGAVVVIPFIAAAPSPVFLWELVLVRSFP